MTRTTKRAGDRRAVVPALVRTEPRYRPMTDAARLLPRGYARIYTFHVRKSARTSLQYSFFAVAGEDPAAVDDRMRHAVPVTSSGPYCYVAHAADRRAAACGFSSFLSAIRPEDLLNQLWMFSSTFDVDQAVDHLLGLSAVLRMSHLASDLADVGHRLGLPLEVRHERQSRAGEVDILCDRERGRLLDMLQPEYDLLERVGIRSGISLGEQSATDRESYDGVEQHDEQPHRR